MTASGLNVAYNIDIARASVLLTQLALSTQNLLRRFNAVPSVYPFQPSLFPLSRTCKSCGVEKFCTDFGFEVQGGKLFLRTRCQPCRYQHEGGADRSREYGRQWRANITPLQREQRRQRNARWVSKNRAAARQNVYRWRSNHPEYTSGYYQRTKAERAAYARRWREANPDKNLAKAASYRARKAAVRVVEVVDYGAILKRDGLTCHICEQGIDRAMPWRHAQSLTFDHVMPISRGGSHTMANLKPAHWGCNARKSNKLAGG